MSGVFDRLRDLVGGFAPASDAPDEDERLRVATAALMVRVIEADGKVTETERAELRRALTEATGLDDAELDALAEAGRAADHGATDLYEHTSLIRRAVDMEMRVRLVGMLYELAFADDELHEGEDATVERIASLLGVDPRDRVLARKAAADRRGTSPLPRAG